MPRMRARAFDVLGDMGTLAKGASQAILDGLSDSEDDPRRRAAEALGTIDQNDSSFTDPLADLVANDPSGMVRRNAALSLARLGSNAVDAIPTLASGMLDPNHYVRGYSVHALSRIGTPEAAQAAFKQLEMLRYDRE